MEIRAITVVLLLSGCISLFLSFYIFKFRSSVLTRLFSLTGFGATLYSVGYGFELSSPALKDMLFWSKVQYLGISFLPGLVLIMSICYTGREKWLTRSRLVFIFSIPLITLVSRLFNQYHYLFYKTTAVNSSAPFT